MGLGGQHAFLKLGIFVLKAVWWLCRSYYHSGLWNALGFFACDFSTALASRSAQCGDMSVPEPPPPDGVLTGPSDSLEAGEPTPGLSDTSPDEGLIEDFPVDDRAVEHLVGGLLSHYLPDLQRSKRALQELTQNQVVLLDTLEQEISKFKECHSMLDINALFTEAKHYHAKLVTIRKEMLLLHEKTSKLKKRALKLQQKRQREELEREQQREKEFEREKQLTAKPAKRT